jgi:rod shape-determining protein MreB
MGIVGKDLNALARPKLDRSALRRNGRELMTNVTVDISVNDCKIALNSPNGAVYTRVLRGFGSNEFDEAIAEHFKRACKLLIGKRAAAECKDQIGSAYPLEQELTFEMEGSDFTTGATRTVTVGSEEIREALRELLGSILESIRITLEKCPPNLSAGVIEGGIVVSGAGAVLRGIDKSIAEETGLPARLAGDPRI